MQKTEYRCVGGCVGGWGNDSLVLTLDRQKKTTLSGTSTADDARPYEGLICCEAKKKELRRKGLQKICRVSNLVKNIAAFYHRRLYR